MHFLDFFSAEPQGQTSLQLAELLLALLLSSLIGLEREFRMKSAGLRTHTLVGVAGRADRTRVEVRIQRRHCKR